MPQVTVTKLSKADGKQYFGGTYFVEQDIADELVAGGHAEIVTDDATVKPDVPKAPPFLPSKASKKDAPKVAPKAPLALVVKTEEPANTEDK